MLGDLSEREAQRLLCVQFGDAAPAEGAADSTESDATDRTAPSFGQGDADNVAQVSSSNTRKGANLAEVIRAPQTRTEDEEMSEDVENGSIAVEKDLGEKEQQKSPRRRQRRKLVHVKKTTYQNVFTTRVGAKQKNLERELKEVSVTGKSRGEIANGKNVLRLFYTGCVVWIFRCRKLGGATGSNCLCFY